MSSGCGDVLSLADLQTAKKHQLFEAEVITGKQGGVASGADIDYATNQATGQTQKTLPAVLRDAGFRPASFTFATGGTLAVGESDKAVLWPISSGGDGAYYAWNGTLPKVIPSSSTPAGSGGISSSGWVQLGDITLRADLTSSSSVKGADLVLYNPSPSGAISRSVNKKLNDILNVKDFGAKGDGVTDDTVAIQAASDSLSPRGGVLYFPKGSYKMSSALLVTNMPIEIKGDGLMSTSIEQVTTGQNGVSFLSNTPNNAPTTDNLLINTLHIHDISINRASGTGGIAVDCYWGIMTSNSPQLILERFRCYSKINANFCWGGGVRAYNANGVRISKTQVHGNPLESALTASDPYSFKFGLQFNNSDDSLGLISFFIDSLTVMCASIGVEVNGWHEGFEIVNSEIVQCATGIRVLGNATHLNPDFLYLNSHIEARVKCISVNNLFKLKVANCDIFKSSTVGYVGCCVELNNAIGFSATGTTFSTNDSVESQGIITGVSAYHGAISGCQFFGFTTGKGVELSGSNFNISSNVFYNCQYGLRIFGDGCTVGVNKFTSTTTKVAYFTDTHQITPFEYNTDAVFTVKSAGPDQGFTVNIPSGVFSTTPAWGYLAPVSIAGPMFTYTYNRSASSATSASFTIKSATSIATGDYIFAVCLKSKLG